jgi:hypothetical protein
MGTGFSDVIVDPAITTIPGPNEGRAFVFHGSTGGLASLPAWTADGGQSTAFLGISAGTGGRL